MKISWEFASKENQLKNQVKSNQDQKIKAKSKDLSITTENEASRIKILKKTPANSYQRLFMQRPIHIKFLFNFRNLFVIDEDGLRNSDECDFNFSTTFYQRSISKVEIRKNQLILFLINTHQIQKLSSYMLIQQRSYFCERLKSFGLKNLFIIANQIEEIDKYIESNIEININKSDITTQIQDRENIIHFMKQMKNKKYIANFKNKIIIFSNKILKFLGYQMQEIAQDCTIHKSLMKNFLRVRDYSQLVMNRLNLIKMIYFKNDNEKAVKNFHQEQLFHKNGDLILCKVETKHTESKIAALEVLSEINRSQKPEYLKWNYIQSKISHYKNDVIETHALTANKIMKIPSNLLSVNKELIPQIKDIVQN